MSNSSFKRPRLSVVVDSDILDALDNTDVTYTDILLAQIAREIAKSTANNQLYMERLIEGVYHATRVK